MCVLSKSHCCSCWNKTVQIKLYESAAETLPHMVGVLFVSFFVETVSRSLFERLSEFVDC